MQLRVGLTRLPVLLFKTATWNQRHERLPDCQKRNEMQSMSVNKTSPIISLPNRWLARHLSAALVFEPKRRITKIKDFLQYRASVHVSSEWFVGIQRSLMIPRDHSS